jgi:acyl-CoA dehydrogenase
MGDKENRMNFDIPPQVAELADRARLFMEDHVYPAETTYFEQLEKADNPWTWPPIMRELRERARAEGLWNFPLGKDLGGLDLTLMEYAPIAGIIARSPFGTEVFNCYSGTILNARTLNTYGSPAVKDRYLTRLVNGEIRACISITESGVPASDPTELKLQVRREGDEYILNGKKDWATGAMMPECETLLVLTCTDPDAPRHQRHSMILVPRDSAGLTVGRNQSIFGYNHAPYGHPELIFENVRVPAENLLGNEGEGFLLMQTGLGIGRIQLGMGSVGAAERALGELCKWSEERIISGSPLADRGVVLEAIANSRIEIDQATQQVYKTAYTLEKYGSKAARSEVAQCKVLAPNMALKVLDRAIQFHGGAGVSFEKPLAEMYAYQRTVRIGEGADEVHRLTIAKTELKRQRDYRASRNQN